MFYPDNIRSIQLNDCVLEIGPGSAPHPRADVFLDKYFKDEQVALAQSGFSQRKNVDNKPFIYYDGEMFPFRDNAFDYIICSHVLEHIPVQDLHLFMSEIQRVASRDYLEFPSVFYELINYQDVHIWLMNYRNGIIYFLDKSLFRSNYIHKIYREMFYGLDTYMRKTFQKYKELYFCGFEWENEILYEVTADFDKLVDEDDYNKRKTYFSKFQNSMKNETKRNGFLRRYIRSGLIYIRHPWKFFRRITKFKKTNYSIHKTAQIEKKELVAIKDGAEIKDYVIIRTYRNPVVIGKYAQINPFTVLYGGSGIYIGDNVMIAPHCMIAAGDHDFKQLEKPIRFADSITKGPIYIEDNVWVGANVTITDGVRIGNDAVVAANSVITKDVAPFDIVGGVPAKVLGNRKNIILNGKTNLE